MRLYAHLFVAYMRMCMRTAIRVIGRPGCARSVAVISRKGIIRRLPAIALALDTNPKGDLPIGSNTRPRCGTVRSRHYHHLPRHESPSSHRRARDARPDQPDWRGGMNDAPSPARLKQNGLGRQTELPGS